MFRTDSDLPVSGFGPLTVDDLALRAERAKDDHMATYTATEVLHRAFMAEQEYDPETSVLVDAAVLFLKGYREKTRDEWRATYRDWATAAGIEILPDEDEETFDVPDREAEV
ncbi:cysteine protease [Frankia sp. AgB1.9]|uniref:cysteine protease n=1 Tax=unclassified Frankia TaxID=2632575 RepID=UPI001933546E|nr:MULTISPECIES: cysteine protease [unclassified Frankia]MBL7489195.1 cysteine protease [Frankia sp. AgW1.1]MBL7554153.1 cysteine protease [Frankia sp. AgB1.9]MBL7618522.1 cysteine protease [Frankia sp. AgB1.8]